jgi:hypothetical protein
VANLCDATYDFWYLFFSNRHPQNNLYEPFIVADINTLSREANQQKPEIRAS